MEGTLKFKDLPPKYQFQARQWAIDAWNEIYEEQGLPLIDGSAPEVQDLLDEWEFEIDRKTIEGIRIERLVRC